jgi:hypothetical protein
MDKEPYIVNEQPWARTEAGKVILRLIEGWEAGITEHGDIAICLTSKIGNNPAIPSHEVHRAQFICTAEDAKQIAHMLLRTAAFAQKDGASDFIAFRNTIQSPVLRALADDWNQARGTRRMPSWKDIQPASTAPYLGCMWGFDQDASSGEFIGRLAGSQILQSFCKNFLGTPLRDLHQGHVFKVAHDSLTRVVSEPGCCRFSGRLFRISGKLFRGERLLLPIGADPSRPDGVLGASSYDHYPPLREAEHVEPLRGRTDWCRV